MNHLNSKLLASFAAIWAVLSNNAGSQMMRQPYPTAPRADLNPYSTVVREDQWIDSIVDRWLFPQRKAWRSLDPRFRGWVSHLLWTRKNAGRLSAVADLPEPFHVPSSCPVAAFMAPVDSVSEAMDHFRELMPDINWNAWNNIEPKFREVAEWEMSAEHAGVQLSKARKRWWDLNSDGIKSCLDADEPSNGSANRRHEQIDRRAKAELQAVNHMIAPEPIKQEAQERISDAAAVDKYMSDATRRKL
jgi:hypothetical protein